MSLPIPLTVRLATSRGDRHVTADVRDLTVRWVDPGGYASCRISLDRPLTVQPDEIGYYGTITVYDARTGMVVWDGRQEDPGRSAGDGQVWDLAAVGGQAHTRDVIRPLAYVDSSLQSWQRIDNVTPGGQDGVTSDPGDTTGNRQALVLRIPQGTAVVADSRVVVRNPLFAAAGQKIARVAFSWDSGFNSTALYVQAVLSTTGVGTADTVYSVLFSTAGGSTSEVITTDWSAGNNRDRIDLRLVDSTVIGNVNADTWWASFYNVAVRALLLSKSGAEITSAASYTANTVLASEVVADLLGRVLTQYDGANATITATTHGIDQLMYPDGVDAARVLSDLLALETGHTWRVWERNSAGRYRFEFIARESSVRYEADVTDGYDSQGSADGLYNAVTVRWRDPGGEVQTTTVTGSSPALTAAGLTRQGSIDLGDEVGSAADATRAGQQWLAERAYAPNAGRLRIARPILDIQTGRMVQPWEIRPGLIRVRGILPRPDALNASNRDGVTVFRIVASEYRTSDAAATLDLDSYPATVPQLLASMLSRPVTRRR